MVFAIDGRSAAGKSTLAAKLSSAGATCAVVHTDDVAWNEPFFTWARLLAAGVLEPVRLGQSVSFRPPAWQRHDRSGSITVDGNVDVVIVEGVGAAQRAIAALIDVVIWVQSDAVEAERRGIARDLAEGANGDEAQSVAFWHEWMAYELAFLERDQPWSRAAVIVCGTPPAPIADDEVMLCADRCPRHR